VEESTCPFVAQKVNAGQNQGLKGKINLLEAFTSTVAGWSLPRPLIQSK
jgi:hypothetical protein